MNNNRILYLCLLILISLNLSFNWPLKNSRITSTFGESRGDHFHDGIDVISGNERIYPVAEGELLFFWDRALFPTENYGGVGNYKIIKHNDELISLYMHLQDNQVVKRIFAPDEKIGRIGNTGRSYGKHLHFSFLKMDENKSINPFRIMPEIKDKKDPKVLSICLKIGKKYYPIRDKSNIRLTKHYPLHVKIIDFIKGHERLGIYKLNVIFNGDKVLDTTFSEIGFNRNELIIQNKPFENLYDNNGYYLVEDMEYRNGINELRIIASDFSGNKTVKNISFDIKLEVE